MEENVIVCGDLQVTKTEFPGLCIVEPKLYGDNRGWFTETYSAQKLAMAGIHTVFVQDNQSFSAQKGTLRGLHFQTNPKCRGSGPAQGKPHLSETLFCGAHRGKP